jgi:CHAD domain-containing protein
MAYAFDPARDVAAESRRIVREQLQLCEEEFQSAELDRDVVVHSVRKRLKRIRALLRLVRAEIRPTFREANILVRDAGRRLAPLRDANIVLATLDSLRVTQGTSLSAGDRALLAQLEQILARSHDQVRARGGYRRAFNAAARDLIPLRRLLSRWRFRQEGFDALGPGFELSYGLGREAMKAALKAGEAGPFHEWRKRVKDHWHHCELLAPGWRAGLVQRAERVHLLADTLGTLQDVAVLEARSAALTDTPAGAPGAESLDPTCHALVRAMARREEERLMGEATAAGTALYRRTPATVGASVAAHWSEDQPSGRPS